MTGSKRGVKAQLKITAYERSFFYFNNKNPDLKIILILVFAVFTQNDIVLQTAAIGLMNTL